MTGLFEQAETANLDRARPLAARMRPRNLDEFVGQRHFLGPGQLLRRILDADRLSSAIFYGPPGTGKTLTILALSRQLYGPSLMKSRVLELNASDERGINVVRTKIKNFAQYTVNKGAEAKAAGFTCAECKQAGYTAREAKAAGFSAEEGHKAGYYSETRYDMSSGWCLWVV